MDEHKIVYVSTSGVEIVVTVPWGYQSGNIPPAYITFAGGETFVYSGSRD